MAKGDDVPSLRRKTPAFISVASVKSKAQF